MEKRLLKRLVLIRKRTRARIRTRMRRGEDFHDGEKQKGENTSFYHALR